MDSRKLIDVSSFLLFEASGDSEQLESDPGMAVSGYEIDVDKDDDDDDDAESCSCELSENIARVDDELDGFDAQGYDDYYHDHDEDDYDDDEDGNDQAWTSKPMGLQRLAFGSMPRDRKSRVCVGSSEGESNEKEKSRLFWEACLAS